MPLNIRSEEVIWLADKLASLASVSKTEAVRMALINELERGIRPFRCISRSSRFEKR